MTEESILKKVSRLSKDQLFEKDGSRKSAEDEFENINSGMRKLFGAASLIGGIGVTPKTIKTAKKTARAVPSKIKSGLKKAEMSGRDAIEKFSGSRLPEKPPKVPGKATSASSRLSKAIPKVVKDKEKTNKLKMLVIGGAIGGSIVIKKIFDAFFSDPETNNSDKPPARILLRELEEIVIEPDISDAVDTSELKRNRKKVDAFLKELENGDR